MANLNSILRFRKEVFFEGAVQADWFYDDTKREKASECFVFHGPEYFGVTKEDITYSSHELIDTCSFTELIAEKLYSDKVDNPLLLTIAGYGTGKSHLALTLATLFNQKNGGIQRKILNNISRADKNISKRINSYIEKPNLIITLNGMKDFNLNFEIMSAVKKTLRMHNLDEGLFKQILQSYEIATQFVNKNYTRFSEQFNVSAKKHLETVPNHLKEYLINNIENEPKVFEVINEVYFEANGTYIRWEEGLSAGDILEKLANNLCGDRGYFNKILVIFDEFGRFIEYAATYPTRAGESALQQIFEAIQNSNNQIIFVGLIQSDLKTYLARVDRSSNINRYVGRYEASTKIHLSSNLETIFANLIERKEHDLFNQYISKYFNKKNEHELFTNIHRDLLKWLPTASKKGVWKDWDKFKKVILEGTYPLHPVTTWMLANISQWLQQRSALTFLGNELEIILNNEIKEFGNVPYIKPIRIVQTHFFNELLLAEEEGRQQSEYCIQYNNILRKYKDKFNQAMLDVLAAILILRIGRFNTNTLDEVKRAITYCVDLSENEIDNTIVALERDYGVISFDEVAGCFDFIEDATGANDFKRFIKTKQKSITLNLALIFKGGLLEKLNINNNIETKFGVINQVKTREWQFTQELISMDDLNEDLIKYYYDDWKNCTSPERSKGKVVWVFTPSTTDNEKIKQTCNLINSYRLGSIPIVFYLLDDKNDKFIEALTDYQISNTFSDEEKMKFARFIGNFREKVEKALKDIFLNLALKRELLTGEGLITIDTRLNNYCDNIFSSLYEKIIPFPFEGFANKSTSTAKKHLSVIAKNLLSDLINYQWVQAQGKDVRNRLERMLTTQYINSWGLINENFRVVSPNNIKVKTIFNKLDDILDEKGILKCKDIFNTLLYPPYGLNEYSLSLLLACYFSYKNIEIKLSIDNQKLKLAEWANQIFIDKGVNFTKLEETNVIKVNPDGYSTKYLNLCNKIEKNNNVIEAKVLNNQLEELEKEEDIPEELKDRVATSKLILEEGIKLADQTENLIGELRHKLEKGKANQEYKHILPVILEASDKTGPIKGSTRYIFSPDQKEIFASLEDEARDFVEENYENWLDRLKCDNIAQVTFFENWLRRVIDNLKDASYEEYARKTKTKLQEIIGDLDKIKQLQTIKETVQNFISTCKPSEYSNYEQLLSWKKEAENIIHLINSNLKLKSIEKKAYIESIQSNLEQVEQQINEINGRIMEVFDRGLELIDIKDSKSLITEIKYLLDKSLRPTDIEDLENLADEIQNFLNDVEYIDTIKYDRVEINNQILKLKEKWEENYYINVDNVIEDYSRLRNQELDEYGKNWEVKYLQFDSKDIVNWSSTRCINWLENIKATPLYLTSQTIDKVKKIKVIVEDRIKVVEVEAVITLFKNLSFKQRRECLELLKQMTEISKDEVG